MTDFDAARRTALIQDLVRIARGRPVDLLPFEAVQRELKLRHLVDRGIREVPLDRIVGSLGRTAEFNRAFRPRDEALRDRWEDVREVALSDRGFPPVELYQVDQAYFVVDGHHRVSVERALGAPTIEAWVKEFPTPVPLDPDATIEEILLRRGLAEFLEATGVEPEDADELRTTLPQGYERLIEHIRVHGYYKGQQEGRDLPWTEEVASWRATVYRPMVEAIRKSRVLEQFPGRTETDLYLYTMDHLHHLREQVHDPDLPPEVAVEGIEPREEESGAGPSMWRRVWNWVGRRRPAARD